MAGGDATPGVSASGLQQLGAGWWRGAGPLQVRVQDENPGGLWTGGAVGPWPPAATEGDETPALPGRRGHGAVSAGRCPRPAGQFSARGGEAAARRRVPCGPRAPVLLGDGSRQEQRDRPAGGAQRDLREDRRSEREQEGWGDRAVSKRTGRPQRRWGARGVPGPRARQCVCRVQEVGAALAAREEGRGQAGESRTGVGGTDRKAHPGEGTAARGLLAWDEAAWVLSGACGIGTPAVSPQDVGPPNESAPQCSCPWSGLFAP